MKNFLTVILFSFLLSSCIEQGGKQQAFYDYSISEEFVQGSEDIPLLKGMKKMLDEGLGFDSSSGSIMTSSYKSEIALEGIRSFYQKTLPQMGWHLIDSDIAKLVFEREKESLEIELVNKDGQDMVRFFISSSL